LLRNEDGVAAQDLNVEGWGRTVHLDEHAAQVLGSPKLSGGAVQDPWILGSNRGKSSTGKPLVRCSLARKLNHRRTHAEGAQRIHLFQLRAPPGTIDRLQ
jgi:hypothetical protein